MKEEDKTKEQLINELAALRRRTDELETVKSNYQNLLENIPQKIFYKDNNSVYVAVNYSYARDFDVQPDYFIGKTDYDFFPKALAEKYRSDDRRIIQSGQTLEFDESYLYKGEEKSVHTIKAAVFDADGNLTGILGIFWDITERKKMEVELKGLNQRLLHHSQELEQAYKHLESFSYAVSHDLKAPITRIKGFADVLLREYADRLDDQGRDLLARIIFNTKDMQQLIQDLLAFSLVGSKEIQKSRIDMEALAKSVFDELKPKAGERNIQMQIRTLPVAYGTPPMIYQVLVNLVSNAIKFTITREKATIEVGGYAENDENIYFIQDNGIGFDMKFADKLFCLFQKVHISKQFEGTGIGLVIAKRIIEKHGGRVWAKGKPDEGATFYFSLPRAHDAK